jgi:hypothetical protein
MNSTYEATPRGKASHPANGYAIASVVLSSMSWLPMVIWTRHSGVGVLFLSIIYGFIALRQIKRRGERGRGLAIASLVIAVPMLLVALGFAEEYIGLF